jgi:hypothetical protein
MDRNEHARYVTSLQIDEDDLDRCLVEQPKLYYHAAEAMTLANSRRDKLALQLKELTATVNQEVRETIANNKLKSREDDIKQQVLLDPEVKKLAREHLEACTEAELAQALKESYQQRSYALKDLVAKQLGELYSLGVERGSVSAKHRLAERIEAKLATQKDDYVHRPRR